MRAKVPKTLIPILHWRKRIVQCIAMGESLPWEKTLEIKFQISSFSTFPNSIPYGGDNTRQRYFTCISLFSQCSSTFSTFFYPFLWLFLFQFIVVERFCFNIWIAINFIGFGGKNTYIIGRKKLNILCIFPRFIWGFTASMFALPLESYFEGFATFIILLPKYCILVP